MCTYMHGHVILYYRMSFKHHFFLFLLLGNVSFVWSQTQNVTLSSVGNKFVVGFPRSTYNGHGENQLFVANTGSINVSFTVTPINVSGSVSTSSTTVVNIPSIFEVSSINERNKGILVEADGNVNVYGISFATSATADAYLALPCNEMVVYEYEYYGISYISPGSDFPSVILMVACENETVVNFEYSTITLNSMETYQIESGTDLTGTRITSSKPLSVFSGSDCANVPRDVDFCDQLVEQVPPTVTWGSKFFVASLEGRSTGERIRVLSARAANVAVNCNTVVSVREFQLQSGGSFREFEIPVNSFCSIESTSPVLVAQYAYGSQSESKRCGVGDPFMMIIPPIEQFTNNYLIETFARLEYSYVTMYVASEFFQPEHILLDNSVVSGWHNVSCLSGEVCGYVSRVNVSTGGHSIRHQNSLAVLGVSVYGFDLCNSYGYPGGMRLSPIQCSCGPNSTCLNNMRNFNCKQCVGTTCCPPGRDSIWGIEWPETERNASIQRDCPREDISGQATRYCNSEGVWADPDVVQCKNIEFVSILEQVTSISSHELVEQAANLTMQLAAITKPNIVSLLPSSLNTTNQVLSLVIRALEEQSENSTTDAIEPIVDVLSNMLEVTNYQGWNDLQSSDAGSQVLLDNAERLGVLLARSQNANNATIEPVRVSRPNIAISSNVIDTSKAFTEDITFPKKEDLVNFTNTSISVSAAIRTTSAFLTEIQSERNNTAIPTVFIIFQNLGSFLPTPTGGFSNTTQGASIVISSQVGERGNGRPSQTLQQSPLSLNFTFNKVENSESYRCVFWNFSEPVGNGGWISDGVSTVGNATEGSTTTVQCSSTHLTSFAVLVDLGDGLKNISEVESIILDVVSYAGCSISVLCLIVTVVFFLAQGRQLFNKIHYFVHLNLSISLLLAYFVFSVGIETAVGNTVGCAFVTALLHYLFLAVFCWMLCEGVMLYLMLVAVFSAVTKKWWFFLMLGYLLPLPFVLTTVAVRWYYYGVTETKKSEFCWLTTKDGTIFGFVAPMLAVLVINVVFLGFILRVLWNDKTRAASKQSDEKRNVTKLAKSLLKGVVVLLPLLGLTWAFGLLTLVSNTSAFAWIFTILNSFQGVTILFFHVIRNDKVRGEIKIGYWYRKFCRTSAVSSDTTSGMPTLVRQSSKGTLLLSEHSEQSQYSQLPIIMEVTGDSMDTKVNLEHIVEQDSDAANEDLKTATLIDGDTGEN